MKRSLTHYSTVSSCDTTFQTVAGLLTLGGMLVLIACGGSAAPDHAASYEIDEIAYAGPLPAAPLFVSVTRNDATIYQSANSSCDLNALFASMIQNLNGPGTPYGVEAIVVSFAQGTQGACGSNSTGAGMLTVVRTNAEGKATLSYEATCEQGHVYQCVNSMLSSGVADLNAGVIQSDR